jgi:hypothetical protein
VVKITSNRETKAVIVQNSLHKTVTRFRWCVGTTSYELAFPVSVNDMPDKSAHTCTFTVTRQEEVKEK